MPKSQAAPSVGLKAQSIDPPLAQRPSTAAELAPTHGEQCIARDRLNGNFPSRFHGRLIHRQGMAQPRHARRRTVVLQHATSLAVSEDGADGSTYVGSVKRINQGLRESQLVTITLSRCPH